MPRRRSPLAPCADAALGSVAALAAARNDEIARHPGLRRLVQDVAAEAAGPKTARQAAALALGLCRGARATSHPWLRRLRAGRTAGAAAVVNSLLRAAKNAGRPTPKLSVIAAVLRRLEPRS